VLAEFFNLFNSANVSQINPVFGSGVTPIPDFKQPTAEPMPDRFSFLSISSFERDVTTSLLFSDHS
jgi:hypothetical protein